MTIREIWSEQIEKAHDSANFLVMVQRDRGDISEEAALRMRKFNALIAKHCRRQMVSLTRNYMKQLDAMKEENK